MLPFVPVAIGTLVIGAYYSSSTRDKTKGVMTPQRQAVFETAINEVKDVEKLKALAKAFREEGLEPQAELLEKRVKLRELPSEIKAARKNTFRKAMASNNPDAVRRVADVFEGEGANGAASALRDYADSLVKKSQEAQPVIESNNAVEHTEIATSSENIAPEVMPEAKEE